MGVTIVVVALATLIAGRGRQRATTGAWLTDAGRAVVGWRARPGYAAGVAVWAVLLVAVVGWDLNSFAHQAHDLPTLSYLVGRVTRFTWGRALVYAAWLAAGAGIAVGCLTARAARRAGADR
ncbi:MAG: hypothetical protein ACLP62_03135 [Acidimicrobiales bacterium]